MDIWKETWSHWIKVVFTPTVTQVTVCRTVLFILHSLILDREKSESSALAVIPSSSAVWLLSLISTYFCSGWLNLQCSVKEIWICSIKCSLFSNVSYWDNNIQLEIVYGAFFFFPQQPPCLIWFCVRSLAGGLSTLLTAQNRYSVTKHYAL
jgi:uncharacterized membrane protein YesL